MQDRFLAIRHFLIVRITFVLLFITNQIVHQLSFRLVRLVLHHCPVGFLNLTVLEHVIQAGKRLTGFGKNNKTAYGAVQAMCNTYKDITGLLVFLLDRKSTRLNSSH